MQNPHTHVANNYVYLILNTIRAIYSISNYGKLKTDKYLCCEWNLLVRQSIITILSLWPNMQWYYGMREDLPRVTISLPEDNKESRHSCKTKQSSSRY